MSSFEGSSTLIGGTDRFGRRMLILSGLSLVLMVAAGFAALDMANRAAEAERWIVHTMDVRRGARVLLVQVLEAETGERGFMLTEDPTFLEPFDRAQRSVSAGIDQIQTLSSDNPEQQERVRILRPKVETLMAKLRRNVELVRQGKRGDAIAIVKSGVGRDLMDGIRADLDMIFAHETELLAKRQSTARALRGWVLGLIGLCLAAAMGLAALTLRSTLHYIGRLQAEAALRRETEETLRQAQKLEAVGQLTGGIAHDFNNLLTIIVGQPRHHPAPHCPGGGRACREVEGAARSRPAGRPQRSASSRTGCSHSRAARPSSPSVSISTAPSRACRRCCAGRSARPSTSRPCWPAGLWPVFADANQLENAVINLAVNARDAMPGGGRLTIETANAYLDEEYASHFGDVSAGQYVLLSVSDTGTGIPPDVLQRVFEPFFTTKGVGEGSGLGLAMVHGFVKQSGGHIRIYSEVGHGTAVKIYLPRLMQADEVSAAPAAAARQPAGETRARPQETMLLVEDNDGVRAYTKSALEELGYRVLEAPDAAQALRLLEGAPRIDLLFTDVVLPGGTSGRELADTIVRQRPRLPVLFTTGYTRNAIFHHGRLDPNVNLLNKPYTQQDLARKIRQLLG